MNNQLEAETASVGVVLGASLFERGSSGKVLDRLTPSGLSLTMLKTFQLGREEALRRVRNVYVMCVSISYYDTPRPFSDLNVRLADELKAPSAAEALQVSYCVAWICTHIACADGN